MLGLILVVNENLSDREKQGGLSSLPPAQIFPGLVSGVPLLRWVCHCGIKVTQIQSLDCHSGADARAVSWISILFLNHVHLWAETAALVSGTKHLSPSSRGCLLSLRFPDPQSAPPLVALK